MFLHKTYPALCARAYRITKWNSPTLDELTGPNQYWDEIAKRQGLYFMLSAYQLAVICTREEKFVAGRVLISCVYIDNRAVSRSHVYVRVLFKLNYSISNQPTLIN